MGLLVWFPSTSFSEPPSGIQPLHQLPFSQIHSLIQSNSIRPLFTPPEQERYLQELERHPPTWDQLHDPEGEEHGARLFALNRKRDDLRDNHPLLTQRVAFRWSGFIREYDEINKGFKVVMGPHPTQTTWGIVRFKPANLPNEMIAIPTPSLHSDIQEHLTKTKSIEVNILFTGTLVPWESIIYGFSHDGLEQGMVMPVIQVDAVKYFFDAALE